MSLMLVVVLIMLLLALCGGGGWYGSRNNWWRPRTRQRSSNQPFANAEYSAGIQRVYGSRSLHHAWNPWYYIAVIIIVMCLIVFLIAFMTGHLGYIAH